MDSNTRIRSQLWAMYALPFLVCHLGCHSEEMASYQLRPGKVDQELLKKSVKDWELIIGGKHFEDGLVLTIDEKTVATGYVTAVEGSISTEANPLLVVSLRPAGSATHKEWNSCTAEEMGAELTISLNYPSLEIVKRKVRPKSRYFAPGVYDARLHYLYFDFINAHSTPVLLAKSQVTLLAAVGPTSRALKK